MTPRGDRADGSGWGRRRRGESRATGATARGWPATGSPAGTLGVGWPGGGVDRFTLPRHVATTAHLCSVYPFAVEAGLGVEGAFLGGNRLSGGGFLFDLHTAYRAGLVQGPNMVISGAGAFGKSAIVKSYLYRSAAFAGDRFVSVIDPKGEWIPLARELGLSALQLRPGGGIVVNPLDAGPHATGLTRRDLLAHRSSVTATLLAIALGQADLSAGQKRIISAALGQLSDRLAPASPTLLDLRCLLADPPVELATALDTTPADLAERRRPLLDGTALLIDEDLRGMCDGPTSLDLDWEHASGLVLDLSALLTNRRALRLVLTAATGWLAAVMYGQPDRSKITIIDEGWAALDDLPIVRMLQDQWRLGRQWGAGNILITHALADLRSQVDDHAAQAKIAEGLLNTTSVRVFLHQNPENIGRLLSDMGLTGTEAALLGQLAPFQALWKIGSRTALVDHVIAPWEWGFADTDRAMNGLVKPPVPTADRQG